MTIQQPETLLPAQTTVRPGGPAYGVAAANPFAPLAADTVRFGHGRREADTTAAAKEEMHNVWQRMTESVRSLVRNTLALGRTTMGASRPMLRNIGRSLYSLYDNTRFFGAIIIGTILPFKAVRNMIERRMLYDPPILVSRDDVKNAGLKARIKDHYFSSTDGTRLHGWYIPAANKTKPTVIYAHGRATNIAMTEPVMEAFTKKGYGIFVFDYRGFGNSGGKPNEEGLYKDFEAASDFIAQYPDPKYRVPVNNQVAVGNSLGGGVVADVATRRNFKAVVLCSTFTTLTDALKYHKNRYSKGIRWMFNEKTDAKFESIGKVPNITSPVMVVHGKQDDVAPYEMGKALYKAVTQVPKQFVWIGKCDHTNVFECAPEKVLVGLDQLLQKAASAPSPKRRVA